MPKGPNGQKRPADTIGSAVMVGKIATGEIYDDIKKSSGRIKSGQAGGKARAASMDRDSRVSVAKKAAEVRWNKENTDMTISGKEKLLSLLFTEERELVNLKFFPGDNVTSEDGLCTAAHDFISRALNGEGKGDIPSISGQQQHIGDLAVNR